MVSPIRFLHYIKKTDLYEPQGHEIQCSDNEQED